MIEVKNLCKNFKGQDVLIDVSLKIDDNEKVMLLGRNGAGKTTLIRLILGEYKQNSGEVLIDNISPAIDRVNALKNISFVPQLPPPLNYTIKELMEYSSSISNFNQDKIIENCDRLELDIKPHLNKPFLKLSGGMKQKVLISIAFAKNTKTIIFDEPTANLDIKGREIFKKLLDEALVDKTYIFISHRTEEFSDIANREIELDLGRVVRNEII